MCETYVRLLCKGWVGGAQNFFGGYAFVDIMQDMTRSRCSALTSGPYADVPRAYFEVRVDAPTELDRHNLLIFGLPLFVTSFFFRAFENVRNLPPFAVQRVGGWCAKFFSKGMHS